MFRTYFILRTMRLAACCLFTNDELIVHGSLSAQVRSALHFPDVFSHKCIELDIATTAAFLRTFPVFTIYSKHKYKGCEKKTELILRCNNGRFP